MTISVFDLFKVGIGPSSSHTVGPMKAAYLFVDGLREDGLLDGVARVHVELFGSLGATGHGHGSVKAVVLGLAGEQPHLVDPVAADPMVQEVRDTGRLRLAGSHEIDFDPDDDVVMHRRKRLEFHTNGMVFQALDDAGLAYDLVEQAYAGYVYGDSTSGQKALYAVGMSGIPIVNVNNNCSTGSTALFLGRQAVASGAADCVLVLGFEQMSPGALGSVFTDRPTPFDAFDEVTDRLVGKPEIPLALRYFGGAGLAHMEKYGTPLEAFARIRAKASRHAANNPLALFRKEVTPQDVLDAPAIWPGVMTRLMACPPTCGAAAALLVSEDFAKRHGLRQDVRHTVADTVELVVLGGRGFVIFHGAERAR